LPAGHRRVVPFSDANAILDVRMSLVLFPGVRDLRSNIPTYHRRRHEMCVICSSADLGVRLRHQLILAALMVKDISYGIAVADHLGSSSGRRLADVAIFQAMGLRT
jgi:hypothetical protein